MLPWCFDCNALAKPTATLLAPVVVGILELKTTNCRMLKSPVVKGCGTADRQLVLLRSCYGCVVIASPARPTAEGVLCACSVCTDSHCGITYGCVIIPVIVVLSSLVLKHPIATRSVCLQCLAVKASLPTAVL
jgi:hypothetical protein